MVRNSLLLACFLLASPVHAWAEQDEFCARIRAFQNAPFEKDAEGKPLRRAIEFHWIGEWLDGEMQCTHGGNASGHMLCAWLVQNTSTEFPSHLPMDILRCHGWKIPAYVNDWHVRQGAFEIDTDAKGNHVDNNDRRLLLEIDTQPREKLRAAIKLSIIPLDEKILDPEPQLTIDEPVVGQTKR